MLKVTLSTFVELVFLSSDNKLKKGREWRGVGGGGGEGRGGRRGLSYYDAEHQT